MDKLTEQDLDNLVTRIKNGDCVLFLGPDLFLNKNNASLYTIFSNQKCTQMHAAGIPYDAAQCNNIAYTVNRYITGLTAFEEKNQKIVSTSVITEKKSFANLVQKSIKKPELFDKLAQLSFYLTINTNPDDQYFQVLKSGSSGAKPSFWFYDFTKENNEMLSEKNLPDDINASNTVVYNVYGYASKDRENSVMLGEAEFVNYSKKVSQPGNGIPVPIKNFIKNEKVCLFLGFQHESWPLKILLQALGFSSGIPRQNISFSHTGLSQYQIDFYKDEMKFIFIDSNTNAFVDELLKRFNADAKIAPVTIQPDKPLLGVFVSKAFSSSNGGKEDARIRNKISANLIPLRRKGFIHLWSPEQLLASVNKEAEKAEKYKNADIFIVMGSDELSDDEVHQDLQLAFDLLKQAPGKKIIPVYTRYFLYKSIADIDPNQWLPKQNNEPVPVIDTNTNEDKACTEVSEFIQSVVTEMINKQANG